MYKQRLKEYVEEDLIYQNYKSGKLKDSSDFDNFCINHIKDIDNLLNEVEQQRQRIEYLERSNDRREDTIRAEREENLELHNKIDKATKELDRIITFCENDSQGGYDVCNMAIKNYKNIRNLLKDNE